MGGLVADVRIRDVTALPIEWRGGDPGAMDPRNGDEGLEVCENWLLRLSRTK